MRSPWAALERIAQTEIVRARARLPSPLAARARGVGVRFESRPTGDWAADGVEPDTMGLFLGDGFADETVTGSGLPPVIVLFLRNIWDEAGCDTEIFREEVERTFLHELGHYLGLDEDGLAARDLE